MGITGSQEILTAQIQALYRHTPMVLTVNVINSGLVAAALTSYLQQTRWWIFFGLVAALTAARAIGWNYYRRRGAVSRPNRAVVGYRLDGWDCSMSRTGKDIRVDGGNRLKRRAFLVACAAAFAVRSRACGAEQEAAPVIGFLHFESPGPFSGQIKDFRQGLAETGYVEG
jgi:hypothetical protein